MIVTFTKLLVIKMVANVRQNRHATSVFSYRHQSFHPQVPQHQVGDKLKKAISEPLAKADMPNNIAASTAATITPAEGCISITSPKASVMVDISNF